MHTGAGWRCYLHGTSKVRLSKQSISYLLHPDTALIFELGKPLFEMCWFYMGIAQIALDPAPPLSNGQTRKKLNHSPGKPLHLPPTPYGQCRYGNNRFQKGASLSYPVPTILRLKRIRRISVSLHFENPQRESVKL